MTPKATVTIGQLLAGGIGSTQVAEFLSANMNMAVTVEPGK
jgi:hypothetical protein